MVDALDQAVAEFAEHLVPEGFSTPSTAYRVELVPLPPTQRGFVEWIDRCRADAAAARYPSGGTPTGVVYVRRGDERWRWDQEPCCELEWLTALATRSRRFHSRGFFVCSLRSRDDALDAGGDHADVQRVAWTMPGYGEARSAGVSRSFAGVSALRGTDVVATHALADRAPFRRAARRVLFRHPSRQRYRLR